MKLSTWDIVLALGIFETSLFKCMLLTISLTIFFLQSLHVTVVFGHSELCCCILQKYIHIIPVITGDAKLKDIYHTKVC